MQFRNVVPQILKLQNCERACRVLGGYMGVCVIHAVASCGEMAKTSNSPDHKG